MSYCPAVYAVNQQDVGNEDFGHLMQRADSLEKTWLMLEKIKGKRRKWQQRMRWLDNIINSMVENLSKLLEILKDRLDTT